MDNYKVFLLCFAYVQMTSHSFFSFTRTYISKYFHDDISANLSQETHILCFLRHLQFSVHKTFLLLLQGWIYSATRQRIISTYCKGKEARKIYPEQNVWDLDSHVIASCELILFIPVGQKQGFFSAPWYQRRVQVVLPSKNILKLCQTGQSRRMGCLQKPFDFMLRIRLVKIENFF